mmetsp:Transcript_87209/g.281700  ORF Transcript_87209/g.281700 Transcript_87209/m.281700 type:complete len:837 (+) Transcript_87209:93-2603(+)
MAQRVPRSSAATRAAALTTSAAVAGALIYNQRGALGSSSTFALAPAGSPALRLPSAATRLEESTFAGSGATAAAPTARPSSAASPLGAAALVAGLAGCVAAATVTSERRRQRQQGRKALPESADFIYQAHLWSQSASPEDVTAAFQAAGEALRNSAAAAMAAGVVACSGVPALDLWPAANAAEPTAVVEAVAAVAEVALDPTKTYLYGLDGLVLRDPMNSQPIQDDWWNGFIGFQAGLIKDGDRQLRALGVEQAFGWSIVAYTVFIKLLFYPLNQSQLKSTSMMQLLAPKVKEIQEKYKNDPQSMNMMMSNLYQGMDVNPLGGCLPVFLQLPIFWSLYGVWRRLAAERFEHYDEGWLWVPSLAQPNPDFQFKIDWMLKWKDGAPEMGWHDFLCYLIFPAILVGATVVQQLQAQAAKPKTEDDGGTSALIMQVLPLISVYFIGSLSLELPQAVSVYYTVNTGLTMAQTALVKNGLRDEIPGYAEYEKTGKFPESAFGDMVKSSMPAAKNLHEAATRGDDEALEDMLENGYEGTMFDVNAWDEKQIAPLGYAVATGNITAAKMLMKRGADALIKDGQDNSLLHYAAGYGQLGMLKEILEQPAWNEVDWKQMRNKKGQTVVDAARVNRKGQVLDFFREEYGLEPAVPLPPSEAEVVDTSTSKPEDAADQMKSRAALLAAIDVQKANAEPSKEENSAAATELLMSAMGKQGLGVGTGGTPPVMPFGMPQFPGTAGASSEETAEAMRKAMEQLRSNPQAVEQARAMMDKIPPSMLSMLSGGKLDGEQAKKAMEAMKGMSTADLIARAGAASDMLSTASNGAAAPAEPAEGEKQRAPARVVD